MTKKTNKTRNKSRAALPVTSTLALESFESYRDAFITQNNGPKSLLVSGSYCLGLIGGSGSTFNPHVVYLNPGMETFPRLAEIARQFESYDIISAAVSFKSILPKDDTTYIVAGVDYDVADPQPDSESELLSFEDSISTQGFTSWSMPLRGKTIHQMKKKMVSSSPSDDRTAHAGKFYLQSNKATTTNIGFLWVHMKVKLYTPQKMHPAMHHLKAASIANSGNNYALVPAELDGATRGRRAEVLPGVIARLPTNDDISAGFTSGFPIYNFTGTYEVELLGEESTSGSNISKGQNSVDMNLLDNTGNSVGTTGFLGEWLVRNILHKRGEGFQPFFTDAVNAISSIYLLFRRHRETLNGDDEAYYDALAAM